MMRSTRYLPNDPPLDEIIACITNAIGCVNPGVMFRAKLLLCMDRLHGICETIERNGEAEEDEEHYLCFFDSLAFIAQATRWPGVDKNGLRKCVKRLNDLGTLAPIEDYQTT